MEKVFEVVRVKQEIRETEHPAAWYQIGSPEDVVDIARKEIAEEDREVFFVVCMNTKNRVIAIHRAHIGSLNASIVSVKDVYRTAILNNSMSIICFHQHPSGDTTPSREDIEVTKRLREGGQILGIELLDHIIVSFTGEYTSLKQEGYL